MAAVNRENYIQRVVSRFPFRGNFPSTVERERFIPFAQLLPDPGAPEKEVVWKVLSKSFTPITLAPIANIGFYDRLQLNIRKGDVSRKQLVVGRMDEVVPDTLRRYLVNNKITPPMKDSQPVKVMQTIGITGAWDNHLSVDGYGELTRKNIAFFLPRDTKITLNLATIADVERRNGHLVRVPQEVIFEIGERSERTRREARSDIWKLEGDNALDERAHEAVPGWTPERKDRLLLHRLFPVTHGEMNMQMMVPRFRRSVLASLVKPPSSTFVAV